MARKPSAKADRAARRVVEHAATVAAQALAKADGDAPPADPEADTEEPGDATPTALNAPPPPMFSPRDFNAKPTPPPATLVAMGAPPDDALAAQAYLYKMLVRSAADAAIDPDLSARERRKELRTISVAAERLMPKARLFSAEQTVLEHRHAIERKAVATAGAKLEKRPKLHGSPGVAGSPVGMSPSAELGVDIPHEPDFGDP